ncbi:hypothetical protein LSAT2_018868 [Lamellibrachia satsuma]|nr:hypothetical protein LSAT2_018868 [Lamellibrachia satsuma]
MVGGWSRTQVEVGPVHRWRLVPYTGGGWSRTQVEVGPVHRWRLVPYTGGGWSRTQVEVGPVHRWGLVPYTGGGGGGGGGLVPYTGGGWSRTQRRRSKTMSRPTSTPITAIVTTEPSAAPTMMLGSSD